MEATNNKRNKVTDELVLSMLIDIEQEIKTNSINYKKLAEKHKGTVYSILAVLRKTEVIIKAGNNIIWNSHSPDITMAKEVREEYNKSTKISHKKYLKNKDLIAEHKKHLESIRVAEEVEEIITDPLNFGVPLNAFQNTDSSAISNPLLNPALIPIEEYRKLQIDSYIRQTSQLQSEIEKLKSIIEIKDETISARQEEYNELLHKASTFTKRVRDLESELKSNKEKRAIRLFGIKIGSIG